MSFPPLRSIVLALTGVLLLAAPARAQTPVTDPPEQQTLSSGWEYRTDPDDVGLRDGWKRGQYDVAWRKVSVPHVFNPTPVDSEFLGTVGWYRMKLKTPDTPGGFRWRLHFESTRRRATVWLNGKLLGHNLNPYQPFRLDAPGMRAPGLDNELVVRVSNKRSHALREGWWNWGGITRPVTLEPVGQVMWEDLGILSDVKCPTRTSCRAIARTDGVLVNHTREKISPTMSVELTSPTGEVTTKDFTFKDLEPFQRRRVGFPIDIQGAPALWSPKRPNLYASKVTVRLGDTITHVDRRNVGLRFIRVVNGRLYLNGHLLQLRGASIQEDLPGRGPALRDKDIETVVADVKRLGANVTRAQYPVNERLLKRLDEEGILFWSQSPVYHEDEDLKTRAGRSIAQTKVRQTVLYARNHPSVMTHSVANELSPYADSFAGTRRFLRRAALTARDLDDTVPAALDLLSYPNIPRQRSYSGFGLLGINSYYGWYDGKDGAQSTARFRDLEPFLRDMRRMYPRQAQMITEFGAEATYNGPARVKETFAFQSRYVNRTLSVVRRSPWLVGAIYWTAREFFVKPDWDGGARRRGIERDALHNKGLIKYDGTPKPAFFKARRLFTRTPVYRGE